jgi:hypothetical protein
LSCWRKDSPTKPKPDGMAYRCRMLCALNKSVSPAFQLNTFSGTTD